MNVKLIALSDNLIERQDIVALPDFVRLAGLVAETRSFAAVPSYTTGNTNRSIAASLVGRVRSTPYLPLPVPSVMSLYT